MPCTHAAAFDPEREIGSEAERLACSRRVGHMPIAVHQCPRRLRAPVVEHGLADELDLDDSVEALDGADEHVVGVVVGRRARVGRDLILVIPGLPFVNAVRTTIHPLGVFQVVWDVGFPARTRAPSDGRSRTAPASTCSPAIEEAPEHAG